MSLKIRKEKRGWLFADGRQTQMSRHRCKGATQEHLTSKNACNERKVESSRVDTDRLKVFFFPSTQTRRQHIQGCSIIHVRGSSPSLFPSQPTRLTRPPQYYHGDVCLHGSDAEQGKIAHRGQTIATAFERQGAHTASRGHSNTRFNALPWV